MSSGWFHGVVPASLQHEKGANDCAAPCKHEDQQCTPPSNVTSVFNASPLCQAKKKNLTDRSCRHPTDTLLDLSSRDMLYYICFSLNHPSNVRSGVREGGGNKSRTRVHLQRLSETRRQNVGNRLACTKAMCARGTSSRPRWPNFCEQRRGATSSNTTKCCPEHCSSSTWNRAMSVSGVAHCVSEKAVCHGQVGTTAAVLPRKMT